MFFYGHVVVTAKRRRLLKHVKAVGKYSNAQSQMHLSFLQAASFKHQWYSRSRKYWRAAVMAIENQIALYGLNQCFMQMPWLVCGMGGEGSGFVVA